MSYIEEIVKNINSEDIITIVEEYEKSDFTDDPSRNRYFIFDKSNYVLPSKYIVKKVLNKKNLNNYIEQLNPNNAEKILKIIFEDYHIEFIDSNKENPFLDIYQEIAQHLITFRDNHIGLVDILEDMKKNGLNVIPLKDYDEEGETKLKDIDPFTFFSTFNRGIKAKNRANNLAYLKEDWELKSKIPTFTPKIPWVQNQKAWFFSWEKDRKDTDIDTLWKIFFEVLNDNLSENSFNNCLKIAGVNKYLTFGLFWLNSNKYIALDDATSQYLKKKISSYNGEDPRTLKYQKYMNLLEDIKREIPDKSFYEIVALKEQTPNPTIEIDRERLNNEKAFRVYLENTKSSHGSSFDDNTIDYFIKDLNINLPYMLGNNKSLLLINDIGILKVIKSRLNSTGDLYSKNMEIGHGRPSQALYHYINFLNGHPTPYPVIKNKILYGPPGTGKTYKLQELQDNFDGYTTVTFHQSYGYEDFVEGLKAETNEDGDVFYKVEKGIFREICEKAEKNPSQNYAIFIDEINRGNISKIFGELITLIEISKRGMKITLPYSKKTFSVPKNLSIIGTMNTADRSIAVLDTALRRRFEFEEMMPIHNHEDISKDIDGIYIQELLKIINKRIEFLYDRDHTIGHAYFIGCNNFEELQNIFKNKIIPLLQEYFYDDWEKINLVFNNNSFIDNTTKYNQNELFSNCEFDDFNDEKVLYKLNEDALKIEEEYKKIYE